MLLLIRLFSTCIVLLGLCELSFSKCPSISPTPKFMQCGPCNTFDMCLMGRWVPDVPCEGSLYCDESLLESVSSPCSSKVPEGCEPTTTPSSAPTTTKAPTGSDPPEDEGAIKCTGVGIYPDPANCTRYHFCPEFGKFSWTQECPSNYAFHYTSPETSDRFPCKQQKITEDCVTVSCAGSSPSTAQKFGSSSLFYTQCLSGTTAVFKCPSGATFTGSQCVHKCTKEGMFANTIDASKYYWCYYVGNSLVSDERTCPGTRKFDQRVMACI